MAGTDTPFPGNRGRGGNFRPLVVRDTGASRIPDIAIKQQLAIGQAVYSALESGQGLLFSPTRNLGAISVILYGPGDPQQTYASNAEELAECLEAVQQRSAARKGGSALKAVNGRQTGS